jgi:excisionase family DNA binding protein
MSGTTPATDAVMVDAREAAKLLRVSERTLWTWTRTQGVPVVKIGNTVRYPVDRLREWAGRMATSVVS